MSYTPAIYQDVTLFTGVLATNSYVFSPTVSLGVGGTPNQMCIYPTVTLGTLTSVQLKVQFSDDNVNWFDQSLDNVAGATIAAGVATVATNSFERSLVQSEAIFVQLGLNRYLRIGYKGTGVVTGSALTLTITVGRQ